MPQALINGQHIFYQDSGGGGPAIVFSHGLLMDHSMFDPQVAALQGGWRCITWDERGHGETGRANEPQAFSYWDSADDLAALLRHLGIERAVISGMSQGGFLSLRFALRYPAMVRALILIDTQSGPETPESLPRTQALLNGWTETGLTPALAGILTQVILGDGWDGAAAWVEKWRRIDLVRFAPCVQALLSRDDVTGRLGEIVAPALVVHGDMDHAIALEQGQALASALGCRIAVIQGAGHAPNLTHPVPVNAAIQAFLAALPR